MHCAMRETSKNFASPDRHVMDGSGGRTPLASIGESWANKRARRALATIARHLTHRRPVDMRMLLLP